MKEYSFAYGSGSVTIPLDERWVKEELIGNDIPALPDLRAAIRKSVEEPIGCPPLRECVHGDQTAVLVVSDMSRFWMRQDTNCSRRKDRMFPLLSHWRKRQTSTWIQMFIILPKKTVF